MTSKYQRGMTTVGGPSPSRQGKSSAQLCDENLLAVSYVRIEPAGAREVALTADTQWSGIAAAIGSLGLRLIAEFADISRSDIGLDRPALRRLLAYVAVRKVSYCVVATLDCLSEDPEDAKKIDRALTEAKVAIVVANDHVDGLA